MLTNTKVSYGSMAKFLHWTVGLLMIGLLAVGIYMEENSVRELYPIHKALGILALTLVAFRLIWKLANTTPLLPDTLNSMQKLLARAGHYAVYFCMFAMPLSGWIMSSAGGHKVMFFGLFEVPAIVEKNKELGGMAHQAHGIIANVFIALIVLHIMAALVHHFYYKDNVLKRMLPFSKNI